MKKLVLVAAAIAAAVLVQRKRRQGEADQRLWAEATAPDAN